METNNKLKITDTFLPKTSATTPVGTSKKTGVIKSIAKANDNSAKLNPLIAK